MSKWLRTLCLALAAIATLSGCGVELDDEGKVVSQRVWFDQKGNAHCPKCDPVVKLVVTEQDPPSAVKPFSNVCEQDPPHTVVWAADQVPCWRCQGTGICQECRGSGLVSGGSTVPCTCGGEEGEAGSSKCIVCRGTGLVRYGG